MKKCPYCAEDIQDEAILCRYCGSRLDETLDQKKEQIQCPYCAELISIDAKICRYCRTSLVESQDKVLPSTQSPPSVVGQTEQHGVVGGLSNTKPQAVAKSYSILFLAEIFALLPAVIYAGVKFVRLMACTQETNCLMAAGDALSSWSLIEPVYSGGYKAYYLRQVEYIGSLPSLVFGWVVWTLIIAGIIFGYRLIRRKRIGLFSETDNWSKGGFIAVVGTWLPIFALLASIYYAVYHAKLISLLNSIIPPFV